MPRRPDKTRRTPSRPTTPAEPSVIERVMDLEESSLLDVLDHVLSKGVMATGDITLGVAADRVLPSAARQRDAAKRRSTRRARRRAS